MNAPQGKASIYDDLLDTLKLLEEDPEPLRQSEQVCIYHMNIRVSIPPVNVLNCLNELFCKVNYKIRETRYCEVYYGSTVCCVACLCQCI